jgi:methylmalonyl-CoA/ethylmalonyl-CoA epimerase
MIRGLHHFCVSVKNIDEAGPFYQHFFTTPAPAVHTLPSGVRFALYDLPDGTRLELLEPVSGKAPPRPPRTRGPGLDHLCFIVDDVEAELKRARELGGLVIGGGSRQSGRNRIGFLQPAAGSGVLIELIQVREVPPAKKD